MRAELERRGLISEDGTFVPSKDSSKKLEVDQLDEHGWPAEKERRSSSSASSLRDMKSPSMSRKIVVPFEEADSPESNTFALRLLSKSTAASPAQQPSAKTDPDATVAGEVAISITEDDEFDEATLVIDDEDQFDLALFAPEADSNSRSNLLDDDEELKLSKKGKKQLEQLDFLAENEFSEEVQALVAQMVKWRRRSLFLASLIFTTGLIITFLWAGSLDPDQQKRWLAGFGEFLTISAVITAPFFILLASASTAWYERNKREEEIKAAEEAKKEAERELAAKALDDKEAVGKKAQAAAQAATKAQIKALIQVCGVCAC